MGCEYNTHKGKKNRAILRVDAIKGRGTKHCLTCSRKRENLSLETRLKLSESHKGEKKPNFGKFGKEHPHFGKHMSEEAKRKI